MMAKPMKFVNCPPQAQYADAARSLAQVEDPHQAGGQYHTF